MSTTLSGPLDLGAPYGEPVIDSIDSIEIVDAELIDSSERKDISFAVLRLPSEAAYEHWIAPLRFEDDWLIIGVLDVDDKAMLDSIRSIMRYPKIRVQEMARDDIHVELRKLYPQESRGGASVVTSESTGVHMWDDIQAITLTRHAQNFVIEPGTDEGSGMVRWFVDGQWDNARNAIDYRNTSERKLKRDRGALRFDADDYNMLVRRVGIAAHLHDGVANQLSNTTIARDAARVQARVNRFDTNRGYSHFIRVLGSQKSLRKLSDLGMSADVERKWQAAMEAPGGFHGVVGPPGVGKNTTTAAGIAALDNENRNTVTIEQPVEILLEYVRQIELGPGESPVQAFQTLLSIQPTLVYVNQILGPDMATELLGAARAGFQLVSTWHGVSAIQGPDRLVIDLGTDLVSTVNLLSTVLAQRLLKRLCSCAEGNATIPVHLADIAKRYPSLREAEADGRLFRAVKTACRVCGGKGYNDMIGVFEIIEMTPELQRAFVARKFDDEVIGIARKSGYVPMFEAALDHCVSGLTSLEAALAVFGRNSINAAMATGGAS